MITPFETMIKDIKKHYKLNNTSLAYELGVSGYAVSSWLGGQRPNKPNYGLKNYIKLSIKKERPNQLSLMYSTICKRYFIQNV